MTTQTVPGAPTHAPEVTSTPATRQERLRRILVYKARVKSLESLIDVERAALEMEQRQAGDTKIRVEEGDSMFRVTRRARVTDAARLAAIVPATVLAERFKPSIAFVEGMQKAGTDWKSCIAVDEPEEFRVERAKTLAARDYYQQIEADTRREAERVANDIARRLSPTSTPPPANV